MYNTFKPLFFARVIAKRTPKPKTIKYRRSLTKYNVPSTTPTKEEIAIEPSHNPIRIQVGNPIFVLDLCTRPKTIKMSTIRIPKNIPLEIPAYVRDSRHIKMLSIKIAELIFLSNIKKVRMDATV